MFSRMLVMPSNFAVATQKELELRLLEALSAKTEHCVSEILSGIRRRIKQSFQP
jgi:hypothetical protein